MQLRTMLLVAVEAAAAGCHPLGAEAEEEAGEEEYTLQVLTPESSKLLQPLTRVQTV